MKLVKFALIHCAVVSVFLLAAFSAQAITDPVWGEAWNSKIGKANCTIADNGTHSAGPSVNIFDNNTGSRFLAPSGATFPRYVTIVVNDGYAPETPDLVLKKYIVYGNAGDDTRRFPKAWEIYGSRDGGVTWDSTPIDARSAITFGDYTNEGNNKYSYSVEIPNNIVPYRAYKINFLADNGANFLQCQEVFLFGEIKEHVERVLYNVSAFDGIYDGYEHGVEVTLLTPGATVLYSRTGADGSWGDVSPTFKDPGEHNVFLKLAAPGCPEAVDTVRVNIQDAPRENVNITQEVRLAGERDAADGTHYRTAEKGGGYGGFGADATWLVDGNDNQRTGWTGSGTFGYTISDAYRPGDAVVATGVAFWVGTNNKGDGLQNFPRVFTLSGWNADLNAGEGGWEQIAAFDTENNPAWTEDELSGSSYRRTVAFANTKAYRRYLFSFTGRTQVSEISLVGQIGAKASTVVNVFATDYDAEYDGYPHGINLEVVSPSEGVTVSYRLDETAEWTTVAPTFADRVVNAAPVYWKAEAEGYEPASGCNTVTIHDAVRGANLDLGVVIKNASVKSTGWNYAVDQHGRSAASDGNLQNIFTGLSALGTASDRHVWTDDHPYTLTLTVNDAYRPGEAIVVSSVVFHVNFGVLSPTKIKIVDGKPTAEEVLAQYGYYRLVRIGSDDYYQVPTSSTWNEMPSKFKLEASRDGGETWRTLMNHLEDEDWTVADMRDVPGTDVTMLSRAYAIPSHRAYRMYRFTFPKRTTISAIQFLGSIGLPSPGFRILVR